MKVITQPTTEPVTADEAKAAARIAGTTEFDTLIAIYIPAARRIAEMEIGRAIMEQVVRAEGRNWPTAADLVPVPGATDVSVTYWDGSAWVGPLDSAFYTWADDGPGLVFAQAEGQTLPELGDLSVGPRVRIDATTGEADAADVPAPIKAFILAMVAYWIDNPQAYTVNQMHAPDFLCGLLDTERVTVY